MKWIVWCPNFYAVKPPTFIHLTEESAIAEAERLAKLHQGYRFFVMRATHMSLVRTEITTLIGADDEIPF